MLELLTPQFGLAIVAVAAAGFVRGFVGFGAALMTVPILAWLYGPLAAVPMSTVMGAPTTLLLLRTAVQMSERPVVVPIGLGVFAAAPLGAWILVSVDETVMRLVISALVVAMVAALARGWRLGGQVPRSVLLGAGVAGGLAP